MGRGCFVCAFYLPARKLGIQFCVLVKDKTFKAAATAPVLHQDLESTLGQRIHAFGMKASASTCSHYPLKACR